VAVAPAGLWHCGKGRGVTAGICHYSDDVPGYREGCRDRTARNAGALYNVVVVVEVNREAERFTRVEIGECQRERRGGDNFSRKASRSSVGTVNLKRLGGRIESRARSCG
jgi:hypothetical protein